MTGGGIWWAGGRAGGRGGESRPQSDWTLTTTGAYADRTLGNLLVTDSEEEK